VGKFKGMQDCFRRHPEEYKEELEMEEEVSCAEGGGESEVTSAGAEMFR
jgi:hypothetical protein